MLQWIWERNLPILLIPYRAWVSTACAMVELQHAAAEEPVREEGPLENMGKENPSPRLS